MTTVLNKEVLYGAEGNGGSTIANKKEKSFRLQLVLPETSFDRLENLKQSTEAASYAEVIRRALRIYEGLVVAADAGSKIVVRKPNGDEEFISAQLIS